MLYHALTINLKAIVAVSVTIINHWKAVTIGILLTTSNHYKPLTTINQYKPLQLQLLVSCLRKRMRLCARSDPADSRACDPLELPSPWRPVAPGEGALVSG